MLTASFLRTRSDGDALGHVDPVGRGLGDNDVDVAIIAGAAGRRFAEKGLGPRDTFGPDSTLRFMIISIPRERQNSGVTFAVPFDGRIETVRRSRKNACYGA